MKWRRPIGRERPSLRLFIVVGVKKRAREDATRVLVKEDNTQFKSRSVGRASSIGQSHKSKLGTSYAHLNRDGPSSWLLKKGLDMSNRSPSGSRKHLDCDFILDLGRNR